MKTIPAFDCDLQSRVDFCITLGVGLREKRDIFQGTAMLSTKEELEALLRALDVWVIIFGGWRSLTKRARSGWPMLSVFESVGPLTLQL